MSKVETRSFSIANYSEVCSCRCRHCLLSADSGASGVEYERAEALAERLLGEIKQKRPELSAMFYAGKCMDMEDIGRYVRFTGTKFLQCNGMGMKTKEQAEKWMREAYEAGARSIDCTFYGMAEAHDGFAGRKGDFEYNRLLMECAREAGIKALATVALTKRNMAQMPELFSMLEERGFKDIFVFIPHVKGRGERLTGERLTDREFEALDERVKAHFSSFPHKTEAEWMKMEKMPQATGRNVTLVLTGENIEKYERMPAEDIVAEIEEMDEKYYAAMPAPEEMAKIVGREENRQIFRFRDLYMEWQKRYIAQKGLEIYDMNEERHSFSVRTYAERDI